MLRLDGKKGALPGILGILWRYSDAEHLLTHENIIARLDTFFIHNDRFPSLCDDELIVTQLYTTSNKDGVKKDGQSITAV